MTLSKYICDLLYRYNCVIIPEFGAFLTQRIPATLSQETHLFFPPQKRISFNNQITTNDGLLANYIAKSEEITYEKATLKIQYFVQEIREKLKNTGRVSLSEIGFFSIGSENKLTFEPLHTTNYLTESFGLSTFKTFEVSRNQETALLIQEENNTEDVKKNKERNSFVLKYAAVGLLLLGVSTAGVNSYKQSIAHNNTSKHMEVNQEVNNYLQSASFVFEVDEAFPSVEVALKKPETVEEIIYHIVAGAFREQENATKKLNQLKRKGFDAQYIGENKYGLHQIAYATSSDKNTAINTLNKIKKTENTTAWLLRAAK